MSHTAIGIVVILSSMVIVGANLAPILQEQSYVHIIINKHRGAIDLNGISSNDNSGASSGNSNNIPTTTMSHSALKSQVIVFTNTTGTHKGPFIFAPGIHPTGNIFGSEQLIFTK